MELKPLSALRPSLFVIKANSTDQYAQPDETRPVGIPAVLTAVSKGLVLWCRYYAFERLHF